MLSIYKNGQQALSLSNYSFGLIYSAIQENILFKKIEISREQEHIMNALYLCSFEYDFNMDNEIKTQNQAKFLINILRNAYDVVKKEAQESYEEALRDINALIEEIDKYAMSLPAIPANTKITWYRGEGKLTLLQISCAGYKKFRKKILDIFQSSDHWSRFGLKYILEAGDFGYDVAIDNVFYKKADLIAFASRVQQALDEIQDSAEPFDAAAANELQEFHNRLITLAQSMDN